MIYNVLSSAQYNEAKAQGLINSNELYLLTDDENIFIAKYGVTTYAEISAVLDADKPLFCYVNWNDIVCPYIGIVNNQYAFSSLGAGESTVSLYVNSSNQWSYSTTNLATRSAVDVKQDALVSGTNIKTVNNTSLLGSGNIDASKGSFSFTGQGGDVVEGEAGILHLPDENDHTFILGMSGYANEGDPDEEYHLTSDFKFQPDPADYEYGLHWYSDVPIVINGAAGMYLYSNSSGNEIATRGYVGTRAPLASPTFTGTPKAPTATAGTNNTQIATTAFVNTAITNANNIFIATYGTTTYANISAAESAGKTLFAIRTNSGVTRCLPLIEKNAGGQYIFSGEYSGTNVYYTVNSSSNWSETTYALAAYSHSHTTYVTKAYAAGNASNYEVRYAKFLADNGTNSSVVPDAVNKIIWFYE